MLEFDADVHAYTLNGQRIPSVTQVLGDSGVADFSKMPESVREFALERGSYVHLACELHDRDDLVYDSLGPVIKPYLDAYLAFRADTGFKPCAIELAGCNQQYQYAGTLDRIGTNRGGQHWLIDFKSGSLAKWVSLQTAAYQNMDQVVIEYPNVIRYGLQLKKDGRYSMSEAYLDPNDFARFCWLLTANRIRKEYR
jgi:hypothetical protein